MPDLLWHGGSHAMHKTLKKRWLSAQRFIPHKDPKAPRAAKAPKVPEAPKAPKALKATMAPKVLKDHKDP